MSRDNISGNVRLGYSEISDQQPGALGEEFSVIPADYDRANDVYIDLNAGTVIVKLLRNTSGATIAPGKAVKRNTSGNMSYDVIVAGAAEPACAIVDPFLTSDVPIGAKFLGVIYGETDVLIGATQIAKGATIQSGAAGVHVVDAVSTVADLAAAHGVMLEVGPIGTLSRAFVDFRNIK